MSITLTNPYTVSVNGTQVEDDTAGACTGLSIDFLARTYSVTFKMGTLTGNPPNLNVGPYANATQTITTTVYVGPTTGGQTFGQWWLNGVLQGSIIPAATLNSFVSQILGDRNTAEGFVSVSGGLMPGTQVPWTQL